MHHPFIHIASPLATLTLDCNVSWGLLLLLFALLCLALGIGIYRHQRRLSTRVRLMREALHNRDFMFRLPTNALLPGERALQEALNDMGSEINRLMARSEVESWQRLTRVLTHEIMNAVAPIQSITQAYAASPLVKGTPLEEGIRAIYDTSHGLSTFVESYRKMTQLQQPVAVDIDLERLVANLRTLYPTLSWHISLNAHHTIHADASMMQQVLTNIVKNAAEAGAQNIGLSIEDNDDCLQMRVSNDGARIAAEVVREVFVPFFTTKKSGSGIGLSISRQMMMTQGGDLALAENAQVGYHVTFVVTLPQ